MRDFISPITSKELPGGITFQLIDFAVHSGIPTAIRYLQNELKLRADGIIGPVTKSKIMQTADSDLVMLIVAARIEFMTHLDNWPVNSRGWSRRMAANLRYGALDT